MSLIIMRFQKAIMFPIFFNNKKFNQIISFDIKNNFLKILDKVCDEPLADTSIIPMFFLCKFARENITVALSGDGADEIFLGYETYLADKLKNVFDLLPVKITKFLHYFANRFFPVSHNKVSFDYKLKQFLGGCTLPKKAFIIGGEIFFLRNLRKKFVLIVLQRVWIIHL